MDSSGGFIPQSLNTQSWQPLGRLHPLPELRPESPSRSRSCFLSQWVWPRLSRSCAAQGDALRRMFYLIPVNFPIIKRQLGFSIPLLVSDLHPH